MPVYINHMWQCLLRTTPDLTLAPPLPGDCLLSCSFPFSAVPVHIVYLLSSKLRQSYHCTYFFKSRALPIYMCTTCAPLRNLVQPSTCAPLRNLVHHSYSCTSNHVVRLPTPYRRHSYSCTNRTRAPLVQNLYSCTSRAPLVLVHLSCTTHTRAPLVHHSYSCTSRAPLILVHLSCTNHTREQIVLVHQSCSCTHHQAHSLPHSRGTWTVAVASPQHSISHC